MYNGSTTVKFISDRYAKYFLFVLGSISLASLVHAQPESSPQVIHLANGVTIVTHHEKTVFSKSCKAERTWPELKGMNSRVLQKKLNDRFKKVLTVGKPLKAEDCVEDPQFPEDLVYFNSFEFGAQKENLIGIRYIILFPGGSTRSIQVCEIYNLRDGKEIHLAKQLKPEAVQKLDQLFDTPNKPSETMKTRDSLFCLEKDGLRVMDTFDTKVMDEKTLSADQIKDFFALSENSKSLAN